MFTPHLSCDDVNTNNQINTVKTAIGFRACDSIECVNAFRKYIGVMKSSSRDVIRVDGCRRVS